MRITGWAIAAFLAAFIAIVNFIGLIGGVPETYDYALWKVGAATVLYVIFTVLQHRGKG